MPGTTPSLLDSLDEVFGDPSDPIELVERRAAARFAGREVVIWEGDPQTFQFTYVSPVAAVLLGYPAERWTTEPTFWADVVVHPQDRRDAVAYCALATGQCRDHEFEYRAVAADGRIVWLRDVVAVVVGRRARIPERLRGIMLDVTAEKLAEGTYAPADDRRYQRPSRTELTAA